MYGDEGVIILLAGAGAGQEKKLPPFQHAPFYRSRQYWRGALISWCSPG